MKYTEPKMKIKLFSSYCETADLSNGINMTKQALADKNITNTETASLSDFTIIYKVDSIN